MLYLVVIVLSLGIQVDVVQPRYILFGSLMAMASGLLASSFAPDIITLTWLYGILVGEVNTDSLLSPWQRRTCFPELWFGCLSYWFVFLFLC